MIIIPSGPTVIVTTGDHLYWFDVSIWDDTNIWTEEYDTSKLGFNFGPTSGTHSREYPSGTGMYKLLPQGEAWPKESEDTVLRDFLYGLSLSLDRLNEGAKSNLDLILPGDTGKYLTDWERFLGLPKCPGIELNLQQRAASVLAMWNISPYSNEAFYVGIAAVFGYDISIRSIPRGGWGLGRMNNGIHDFLEFTNSAKLTSASDMTITFSCLTGAESSGIIGGGYNATGVYNTYMVVYHDSTTDQLWAGVGHPGIPVGPNNHLIKFDYVSGTIITVRMKGTGEVYLNGELIGTCIEPAAAVANGWNMGAYNIEAGGGNPWAGNANTKTIYEVILDGVRYLPGTEDRTNSYWIEADTPATEYPIVNYDTSLPAPQTRVYDTPRTEERDVFNLIVNVENPVAPTYFKAGASGAGDRLVEYDFGPTECLINFFKPAHTYLTFDPAFTNADPVDGTASLSTVLTSGTYTP